MNQLLKMSIISKLDNKRETTRKMDVKVDRTENLKNLGSSMAKESLKKVLLRV